MGPPSTQVIYKSLNQVVRALSLNKDVPEVKGIMELCFSTGLIQQRKGTEAAGQDKEPVTVSGLGSDEKPLNRGGYPFVVVEGMDGTGKTTLTRFLSHRLQMKLMSTPPKNYDAFIKARDFFDDQGESIRRAYYSFGNYLAANEVQKSNQPVVMDRFWHSTAAYALAHLKKSGQSFQESSLVWPVDLLQPDLVIFLQVSEKERLRRHSTRKAFTNTLEEQTLADDKIFRQNLVQYYRNIIGPPFHELIVDGEQHESEAKILKTVLNTFPELESRLKGSRSL